MNAAWFIHKLTMALLWLLVTAAGGYIAYTWWGTQTAVIIGFFWFLLTMLELNDNARKGKR